MTSDEPVLNAAADATLERLGLLDLRPVYQPVVDLRDGHVVGYEALARGRADLKLESPAQLFAAARAEDVVTEFDAACREAALRGFAVNDRDSAFALFLNADADALDKGVPDLPHSRHTLVIEVNEQALVSRPDTLLRALTRFRTKGWGVAIDDVGADSRSLALMSLLYPDVIKLDLRLLRERSAGDVARIVTAVGAESERRQALVLAEGIDSKEQLATAQAFGAVLGQGYLLGEPASLPGTLPEPGRKLRLTSSGGDPTGASPFSRVTNWRRPARGPRELAERTAAVVARQALELGETAIVLAAFPHEEHMSDDEARMLRELAASVTFVGALCASPELEAAGVRSGPLAPEDPLRGTWTVAAVGPNCNACFVAAEREDGTYDFATSYDRDLVVESAMLIMARVAPLNGSPAPL
ncbi:MAG TPA: EAL domain-containing protein [Solirubrobacteraceae bacterium]|nr:EAL domain-containing protein [Solirubrobacteraceae bacterium]